MALAVATRPHRAPAITVTTRKRVKHWSERNFITEVLIPSIFTPKAGRRNKHQPVFPVVAPGKLALTWIGHASFLIQTDRHNILIDPNWANWLLVVRRLRHAGMNIDHLPNIDLVLVTHAHFDHLNRSTLRRIANRQPIAIPSGVRSLVEDLGFHYIHQMDWWDTWSYKGIDITFVPAKHWGARVLADRHRGYGGFVIHYQGRSVYHVGDSAYFDGFREIGQRCHPEIVLMPIGAYDNPSGRDVHLSPEEALRAFGDLRGRLLIPMHFGTYRLSYEPMHEPPERLMGAAAQHGLLPNIRVLTEGLPEVV